MGVMIEWRGKQFSFFNHKECEWFPCHRTKDPENFNCLFCYCPLYALGENCGGNFTYTSEGVKNCSGCFIPHEKENYGNIVDKISEIGKPAREENETQSNCKVCKRVLWDDILLIGNDIIDAEHKKLVEAVEDLLNSFEDETVNNEVLSQMLDFVVEYTQTHFKHEEDLQEQCGFPELTYHRQEHNNFAAMIRELAKEFKQSEYNRDFSERLRNALISWLINHIRTEDTKIANYIKQK